MKTFNRFLCITLCALTLACGEDSKDKSGKKGGSSEADDIAAKVIYGEDNRLDLYQVQNREHLANADSIVALVRADEITVRNGTAHLSTRPFATYMRTPLCSDEPFRDQDISPICTGFLVAPNIVATAGHCMRPASSHQNDCAEIKFVFGFEKNSSTERPASVPASEVYSCRRIIKWELASGDVDYSIIELDRPVPNHRPLKLRQSGSAQVNDDMYVIGHPSGLPTKVADGGKVRRVAKSYFVASLDTYGGNSGSPVFNSRTHEVEGILVRGEADWVTRGTCLASKRCEQNSCRGEDATLISYVVPHAGQQPSPDEPAPSEPIEFTADSDLEIPDHNATGVISSLYANEAPGQRNVKVRVDISHTWRGDLVVTLVAPDGREIVLSNRQGRSADNIVGVYGGDLIADGLADLSSAGAGTWTLKVADRSRFDSGRLNSWSLIFD